MGITKVGKYDENWRKFYTGEMKVEKYHENWRKFDMGEMKVGKCHENLRKFDEIRFEKVKRDDRKKYQL